MPLKRKKGESTATETGTTEKMPRGPTLLQRIKEVRGAEGVATYKWARERAPDHEVHTEMGNVPLFGEYPISTLSSMDNDRLEQAIDFFCFAHDQYLAFFSRSLAEAAWSRR